MTFPRPTAPAPRSTTAVCIKCSEPFPRDPRSTWQRLCPSCFRLWRRSQGPRPLVRLIEVWPR
jgi:hypothetical protein